MKNCLECKIEFKPKDYRQKFCSLTCWHKTESKVRKTGKILNCEECGKNVYRTKSDIKKSKSGLFFCNKSCSASYHNRFKSGKSHPSFRNGSSTSTYRKLAFEEYGKVCNRCGYDKHEQVLEVHHKDRNRKNNKISNLEVLCANCHVEEHRVN